MIDRIFAGTLLLITLAYGFIAFTLIKAPFQYDPIGPEGWPQILAIVAVICLIMLLIRPDVDSLDTDRPTWIKLASASAMLLAYAELYEPLGFIIATALFATLMARLLGATWGRSAAFGTTIGVAGYLVCAGLMGLNLPAGRLPKI